MRSPAEGITFRPVAIRFIVVLIVLAGGSWTEVFSAAVFNAQVSTSETPTTLEQAEGDKSGREVEGDQAVSSKKSSKTLVEAITRNKNKPGTNEPSESERLDPDRPHLPEASTTAGKGRMILEGGYTFNEAKDSSSFAQDAPEALLRAGILAEWFEVRIGQNFLKQERSISGIRSSLTGLQDLYLGAKVALSR